MHEDNAPSTMESPGGMIAREKYWEEKGLEEKVNALGDVVERLWRRNDELEKRIMLLSKHSHTENGEILVPMKDKEYALEPSRNWSIINRKPR